MGAPMRASASLPRPLVGSVVQAMAVLRHLSRIEQPQGVTAIAARLKISPSSCFNILKTLASEEMASFDAQTRAYTLGPGVIALARTALGRDEVVRAAHAPMQRIAEAYDVAVGLWRLGGRERLTLMALAESLAATRIHLVVGQRQPATAGAAGRAVLAARGASPDAVRAASLQVRWQLAPSPQDYVAQVDAARRRGWGLDADQIIRGVTTVGAALCDAGGTVRDVLTASTFTGRETPDRIEAIGQAVRDAAVTVAAGVYGQGSGR